MFTLTLDLLTLNTSVRKTVSFDTDIDTTQPEIVVSMIINQLLIATPVGIHVLGTVPPSAPKLTGTIEEYVFYYALICRDRQEVATESLVVYYHPGKTTLRLESMTPIFRALLDYLHLTTVPIDPVEITASYGGATGEKVPVVSGLGAVAEPEGALDDASAGDEETAAEGYVAAAGDAAPDDAPRASADPATHTAQRQGSLIFSEDLLDICQNTLISRDTTSSPDEEADDILDKAWGDMTRHFDSQPPAEQKLDHEHPAQAKDDDADKIVFMVNGGEQTQRKAPSCDQATLIRALTKNNITAAQIAFFTAWFQPSPPEKRPLKLSDLDEIRGLYATEFQSAENWSGDFKRIKDIIIDQLLTVFFEPLGCDERLTPQLPHCAYLQRQPRVMNNVLNSLLQAVSLNETIRPRQEGKHFLFQFTSQAVVQVTTIGAEIAVMDPNGMFTSNTKGQASIIAKTSFPCSQPGQSAPPSKLETILIAAPPELLKQLIAGMQTLLGDAIRRNIGAIRTQLPPVTPPRKNSASSTPGSPSRFLFNQLRKKLPAALQPPSSPNRRPSN